jgi:hypothetical protein
MVAVPECNKRSLFQISTADMETKSLKSCIQSSSSNSSRNSRQLGSPRKVNFYPGVSVRECLHINNFTDDEVYNSWYKKQDFQKMKIGMNFILQKISNGSWTGETENETARGLEYRTREGATKRKVNKLNGLMAVLDEQERQWRGGMDDTEAIASAYIAVSSKSLLEVRLLAAKDETEVKEMWAMDKLSDQKGSVSTVQGDEDRKKKTRLQNFMKKIQHAQLLTHPPFSHP